MKPRDLNKILLDKFPELKSYFEEETSWQDGLDTGSIVVFEDVLWPYILRCYENKDIDKLRSIYIFVEDLIESNDEYAKNVAEVAIIENTAFSDIANKLEILLLPKSLKSFYACFVSEDEYKKMPKFVRNNISNKCNIILPQLIGKKLINIKYKKFSNNVFLKLILNIDGQEYFVNNNSAVVCKYDGEIKDDSRFIDIIKAENDSNKNINEESSLINHSIEFNKKILGISIIENNIYNKEDNLDLFNQNGILFNFDDSTNIVIHCHQSKNNFICLYNSKIDYEDKVKLEDEFLKTLLYKDNKLISKIKRTYKPVFKHITYNDEDIELINSNEEIIMYRLTPSGGMGAAGSATVVFKSKNILRYSFYDDDAKLDILSKFIKLHTKNHDDWIDVACGYQNCISISPKYIEQTRRIIGNNIKPRYHNLMNFDLLVEKIDDINIKNVISEADLGIETNVRMGDLVKTLVEKKEKKNDREIVIPAGKEGLVAEVNKTSEGKYYAIVEICEIENQMDTMDVYFYDLNEIKVID